MKVKDAKRFIIDSTAEIYNSGESESIAFILLDFIGFSRKKVFFYADSDIDESNEKFIRKAVKELKNSRPIQYILGETEFFGLKFKLNRNVLIPRHETEEIVKRIIKDNTNPNPVILDLGTGSGCIGISLAKNIPSAIVFATDISPEAIRITNDNAELHKVIVNTIIDDILHTQLDKNLKFDIIVSNPPYVRDQEKQFMHDNVLNFEPASALFVRDENPLEFYTAIADISSERLKIGGLLYVEINENFGLEVAKLFQEFGLSDPGIIRDIHDKSRFVKAIKK